MLIGQLKHFLSSFNICSEEVKQKSDRKTALALQ